MDYQVVEEGDVRATLGIALGGDEDVLVVGSFFIMEQVAEALGMGVERDPVGLNEVYRLT
jgi:hypothetical protein